MRVSAFVWVLALSACASGGVTSAVAPAGAAAAPAGAITRSSPNPFPVQRGSALRPPAEAAAAAQPPPPEGPGPGGIDFGQWRSTAAAAYGPTFQTQIAHRYQNQTRPQIRTDLEANGFACEEGQRLECRIEVSERGCSRGWYVVVEGAAAPVATYEASCATAN